MQRGKSKKLLVRKKTGQYEKNVIQELKVKRNDIVWLNEKANN